MVAARVTANLKGPLRHLAANANMERQGNLSGFADFDVILLALRARSIGTVIG